MIRDLADRALQDGAKHPELLQIAACANWGAHQGNAHRDIMTSFCKQVDFAEATEVTVACIDPKTSKEVEERSAIFLPHVCFSKLGQHYPQHFQEAFCLGEDIQPAASLGKETTLADNSLEKEALVKMTLEKFWAKVLATGDDKLVGHPMTLEKGWEAKTIQIFLHGDGVEFQTRDSLLVFSWGGLLNAKSSLETNMLLAAFPNSGTCASTWPPIWKWLRWSFEALGKGFHPTTDPDGKPLAKGSRWYEDMGKPLHPLGYKACLWSITGDHEFFANVLHLGHWSSHYPCWECDAQNFEGAAPGKGYKEICLEKQNFQLRTHAQQLAEPRSDHPIFQVPHVSCSHVRGDPLHILFTKGLYGHLIGSILHYACYYEGPGKSCKKPPGDRLGLIFSLLQAEYRDRSTANRLTNLKLSMLTDPRKPWAKSASLDCKAGEGKHLLPALVPVLRKLFASTQTSHEQHMLSAAHSLEKLVQLWDEADIVLTTEEHAKSLSLGTAFLSAYAWLQNWSSEQGRNSFAVAAKHHTFIHLLWNSKHLNPRMHWCFKSEDFVGQIAKLTHSISMGVSSSRLSLKVAPKYRVLMHLLLSNSNFVNSCQSIFPE